MVLYVLELPQAVELTRWRNALILAQEDHAEELAV